MQKILFLTFYYPPDLSAGSFRVGALVDAMSQGEDAPHIDVLTTQPNRYGSYKQDAEPLEEHGRVRVRRLVIPAHRSRMLDQARSFASYARQVLRTVRKEEYDLVVASSSRLMTAFLGALISAWKLAPLYLDIRDLFTDTMGDLLAGRAARHLVPIFKAMELLTFRRAARINVVSEAFLPHLDSVAPGRSYRFFPNGIDDFFLARKLPLDPPAQDRREALIVCAGNMGEGQGLHHIIPQAAKALSGKARFRLIGDGGRKPALEAKLKAESVSNVELLAPVSRDELMRHYQEADILFMHLNDVPAFEKVLPSKLFEYGALGRPILAGVAGHARSFLERNVTGSFTFAPCDTDGLVRAFNEALRQQRNYDRQDFIAQFSRAKIMEKMAEDVITAPPNNQAADL